MHTHTRAHTSTRTRPRPEHTQGERLGESSAEDVHALCGTLLNCYLIQLLETGMLHADPHPGMYLCVCMCVLLRACASHPNPTQVHAGPCLNARKVGVRGTHLLCVHTGLDCGPRSMASGTKREL